MTQLCDAVHVTPGHRLRAICAHCTVLCVQQYFQQPAARAARKDGSKMKASIMTPTRIG